MYVERSASLLNLKRCRKALAALTALLCLAAYLLQIKGYAINMPRADDYDMLVGGLFGVLDASTPAEVVHSIFERHGEHLVVFPRLVVLCLYYAFRCINFEHIVLIGNLAVPLVAVLLLLIYRNHSDRELTGWLPVVLLLGTPLYHQASLWACASLEHLWVMVFVLGASWFSLKRNPVSQWLLPISLFLAFTTQGNGVFVFLSLALFHAWERRSRASFVYGVLFAMLAGLHLMAKGAESLHALTFVELLEYIFVFLGSAIGRSAGGAGAIGLALVLLNLMVARGAKSSESRMLVCISLFAVATACANGLARGEFGLAYPITQSRYAFPSIIFICSTYLGLLTVTSDIRIRYVTSLSAIAATCIIWVWSNRELAPYLELYRNTARNSAAFWNLGEAGLEHPNEEHAKALLTRLLSLGAYRVPREAEQERLSPTEILDLSTLAVAPGRLHVEHLIEGGGKVAISGYVVPREALQIPLQGLKLVLISDETSSQTAIIPLEQARPDVVQHYRREDLLQGGFFALVDRRLLAGKVRTLGAVLDGKVLIRGKRPLVVAVQSPAS